MVLIFIAILVVVGIFALWFNIWNHKNPVGGSNKPSKQHKKGGEYSIENLQYINRQHMENYRNEQHIKDMEKSFENKGAV